MDVRHEPYAQEVLNQLICLINQYIKNHTDELLFDGRLQEDLKKICKYIYLYSKLNVDVEGLLSKHNLLSIDVVEFPIINDIENKQLAADGFKKLITEIKSIIDQNKSSFPLPDFLGTELSLLQQMHHIIQQIKNQP